MDSKEFPLDALPAACASMVRGEGARPAAALALDERRRDGGFSLRYVFSVPAKRSYVELRGRIPAGAAAFPSSAALVPAAHAF